MNKTPWTPAPWRYDGDGEARKIRGKDGASIALLMHLSLRARKSDAEVVANARLIASAPDMAEALDITIQLASALLSTQIYSNGRYLDVKQEIKNARAALAKARGEQ